MIITQKQKRLMTIGGVLLVLALLIIAVITALRLQQIGTEADRPVVLTTTFPLAERRAGATGFSMAMSITTIWLLVI